LVPPPIKSSLSDIIDQLQGAAWVARLEFEASRNITLDAGRRELAGMKEEAERLMGRAALAHRNGCKAALEVATSARELLQWACLDWMPSRDVVESGLTDYELDALCSVFGVSLPASGGVGDVAE
jgi:hypothetical protein